MKKTALLLLLLAGLLNELNAQWMLRNNGIFTGYSIVDDISIPSERVAYAIGYNVFSGLSDYNYYTKTINGGISWNAGSIPGSQGYRVSDIFAISNNVVWLAMSDGSHGRIYKSTDGGVNWVRQGINVFPNNNPAGLHFFNANEGVVYGHGDDLNYKEIYTTIDGGDTWTRVSRTSIAASAQYEYNRGFAASGNSIWFGTTSGRVYRSVDKGYTWAVSALPHPAKDLTNLAFSDANNGLVIGDIFPNFSSPDTRGLFRTTDGGVTWTNVTPPTADIFYNSDICYVPGTPATFVAVGFDYLNNGNIVRGSSHTTDGGLTWTLMGGLMPREATSVNYFNQ